jgi:hypothetical protein
MEVITRVPLEKHQHKKIILEKNKIVMYLDLVDQTMLQ